MRVSNISHVVCISIFSMYVGLCFRIQAMTLMLVQDHRLNRVDLVEPSYAFHIIFILHVHERVLQKIS